MTPFLQRLSETRPFIYADDQGIVNLEWITDDWRLLIIAAENLSRYARAIEISPAYVAVCLDRYYRAFDIKPELVTP